MKIYFEGTKKDPRTGKESIEKVLPKMTDDWIDDGNYCDQTIIDLRDACKFLLKENLKLKENIKKMSRIQTGGNK